MQNGLCQLPRPVSTRPAERLANLFQEVESMPQDLSSQPLPTDPHRPHYYPLATRAGDLVRTLVVVLCYLVVAILAIAIAGVAIGAVVWGISLLVRALGA